MSTAWKTVAFSHFSSAGKKNTHCIRFTRILKSATKNALFSKTVNQFWRWNETWHFALLCSRWIQPLLWKLSCNSPLESFTVPSWTPFPKPLRSVADSKSVVSAWTDDFVGVNLFYNLSLLFVAKSIKNQHSKLVVVRLAWTCLTRHEKFWASEFEIQPFCQPAPVFLFLSSRCLPIF